MKTVPLSLSKNYVAKWGVWEAVREILQNAIDTGDFRVTFSPVASSIRVVSRAGAIPMQSLLLGNTSKANDASTLGKFGEGFKLALLVLAREGIECTIRNGLTQWAPKFAYSEVFEGECLVLEITDDQSGEPDEVSFHIQNLPHDTFAQIRGNYLTKSEVPIVFESGEAYAFKRGQETSKLYVGGLFVSELTANDKQFVYSYNFPPSVVDLDRDRSTVSSWKIQSEIANLIIAAGRIDLMVDLSKVNAPDIEGYSSWKGSSYGGGFSSSGGMTFNSALSARAIAALLAEHGPTMLLINKDKRASFVQFMQGLAAEQGRKVVLLTDAHYNMISGDNLYLKLELMPKIEANLSLDSLIKDVKAMKKHMRSTAYKTVLGKLQQLFYKSMVS
jgi:hypothetical protein